MVSRRTRQVLGATAIGTGVAALVLGLSYASTVARRPVRFIRPRPNDPDLLPELGPGLLDVDAELDDEPEPPGIVYDDDGPCELPPKPWEVPVAGPHGPLVGAPGECTPPADLEPLQRTIVPFAQGASRPTWPLATTAPSKLRVSYEDVRGLWHGSYGRAFGASRKSTNKATGETYRRIHVGIDLFADDGDTVLAMEDGEILATLPYYKGLGALYVKGDSGLIVNYGEIRMNSWKDFGIKTGVETGQRVTAGQLLARVGTASDGSHMLHVETFDPETTVDEIRQGEMRWLAGDEPPIHVLDPTRYLVLARQATLEDQEA